MNEIHQLCKLSRYQQKLKENGFPVLTYSTPVLRYGKANHCSVVTVGMNPSKAEFFDRNGDLLAGEKQKFYVRSKDEQLEEFCENTAALEEAVGFFDRYFEGNASRAWFGKQGGGKLEGFLNGLGASFYCENPAVHLDAFPVASSVQMNRIKEKAERLKDKEVSDYRDKMIDSLNPSILLLLGREIGPLFAGRVKNWGDIQPISDFQDALFQLGRCAKSGTPVVWLHFKPSEQFIGLGNGRDASGIHHGTYGSAQSLRHIGSEVSKAVQAMNNDS